MKQWLFRNSGFKLIQFSYVTYQTLIGYDPEFDVLHARQCCS